MDSNVLVVNCRPLTCKLLQNLLLVCILAKEFSAIMNDIVKISLCFLRYTSMLRAGKDSPALELQSHSASVPSSSSVLAPGLISVSHLNAFNNPPVAASTSASAAISNKEKTPMCLINELARFNKVSGVGVNFTKLCCELSFIIIYLC